CGNDSPFRSLLRHSRSGCRGLGVVSVSLPQHPDEHRSEGPVLLPVDQEFGEGATLRVAPELSGWSSGVRPLQVSGGRSQGSKRRWTKASLYCDSHLCWISSCMASCSQART